MQQQAVTPAPAASGSMAELSRRYVRMLEHEMPDVLRQELTVAAVLADLCELAGEPIPPAFLASLDAGMEVAS